jgi:hypothetical protein
MQQQRRRFKQQLPLQDRLCAWSDKVRQQADQLPPGPGREAQLKRARQAETALHLDEWANSAGLQPPK